MKKNSKPPTRFSENAAAKTKDKATPKSKGKVSSTIAGDTLVVPPPVNRPPAFKKYY